MKELNVCIGFDVSSSTIGISYLYILNNKIIKINFDYYKPNKEKSDLENLYESYNYIKIILSNIKEEAVTFCKNKYECKINVFVEDFILYLGKGSTARTITLLAIYNRTVCLAIYNALNIIPTLYSIHTIRSSL